VLIVDITTLQNDTNLSYKTVVTILGKQTHFARKCYIFTSNPLEFFTLMILFPLSYSMIMFVPVSVNEDGNGAW